MDGAMNTPYTVCMDFPVYTIRQSEYPKPLREIPDVPPELYGRGAAMDTTKRMVAFVGARRHSDYARKACEKIITELTGYPITVVSGLAIGIDAVAHAAALRSGLTTVAVVGSGLDDMVLYPRSNRPLAHEILKHGGTLLSELPPATRAAPYTFPSRNRIMAGLSELVIAVECGVRSGTRITTRLALDYNRDVGAVPHGIFSEIGAGANDLLHQGACIIRGGDDVISVLGLEARADSFSSADMSDDERLVYDSLSAPKTKTDISHETNIPSGALQSVIVSLAIKGLVTESGGMVQRQ